MSVDSEFEGVKACAPLLSSLPTAAHQYLEQFAVLNRYLDARDLAGNLASSGSTGAKPIADKLRAIVSEYFERFRDFQAAATRAIDELANLQTFSPIVQQLKEEIHSHKDNQITPTCHVVLQAAQALATHPFASQIHQEQGAFEVVPLLSEAEIAAIEGQIVNLSKELDEIHKKAAEMQEGGAERANVVSGARTIVESNHPSQTASPVVSPRPRQHGPKANMDRHRKIAEIVEPYGDEWKQNVDEVARKLDGQKVPTSAAWAKQGRKVLSWQRAVQNRSELVTKAIEYSLKMARRKAR